MSSAIEVLKEWLDKPIIFNERFMTKEEYIEQVNLKVATQEAIVALEQKEKLVEWLEKEIKTMEDLERINYTGAFGNDLRILKQVLEKVGEQK